MSNLTSYAERELKLAGWFDKDGMYGHLIGDAVMELMAKVNKQGHSGTSACITAELFNKLIKFEPLVAIQGTEDEWDDMTVYDTSHKTTLQNTRCFAIFKSDDEPPYYINALTFKTKNGTYYNGEVYDLEGNKISSTQNITFPFIPKTFVIDVYEKEVDKDNSDFFITDTKQLEEALAYFNKNNE